MEAMWKEHNGIKHNEEIDMFLSPMDDKNSNIVKTEIHNLTTVAHIATKINVAPNDLIEMYQSPDGSGKCNITAMARDFDEGRGLSEMKEKIQEFQDHKHETADFLEVKERPPFLEEILKRGPHSPQNQNSHDGGRWQ